MCVYMPPTPQVREPRLGGEVGRRRSVPSAEPAGLYIYIYIYIYVYIYIYIERER